MKLFLDGTYRRGNQVIIPYLWGRGYQGEVEINVCREPEVAKWLAEFLRNTGETVELDWEKK